MTRIVILSENMVQNSIGLLGEHGFSVWIEHQNHTYLFDTGQTGICVSNAQEMKVPLKNISSIILSHGHYDHCNGLEAVLTHLEKPISIYAHPLIFESKYALRKDNSLLYIGIKFQKEYLETRFKAQFCFSDHLTSLGPDIWMSGTVPLTNDFEKIPSSLKVMDNQELKPDLFLDDNSLFLKTPKGFIVILGCAHRGMVNIVEYAKKNFDLPIRAIIGGTHLMDTSATHYQKVCSWIKDQNLEFLAPAHCTGFDKIKDLENRFGNLIKPAFCGRMFEF